MGRSNHRHPGPPTPPLPGQDSRATLCSMLRGDWQGPQARGEGSPVQSSLGRVSAETERGRGGGGSYSALWQGEVR